MSEDVRCPVCHEPFVDHASAAVHMKEAHRDQLSSPIIEEMDTPKGGSAGDRHDRGEVQPPGSDPLSLIPPEMLVLLDQRVEAKIEASLEAYLPQVQAVVAQAIENVLARAKAAGMQIPSVTATGHPEGGVIQGSPVTSEGAMLIRMLMQSNQGSDVESFIKQAHTYKALGDLFNPPDSLMDRIAQRALIKQFRGLDLISDKMMKAADKELGLTELD